MAEFAWPSVLVPSQSALTLKDGSGRFVSPFTGATRTVSRPGSTRLMLELQFQALIDEKRGALMSLMSAASDGGRIWAWDHSYTKRGSFPATELLGNVSFSATTGWTASGELTLSASEGELRLYRTATTADQYVYYSQVTGLTSGAAYAVRAVAMSGRGAEAWAVRAGSTAGANTYLDSTRSDSSGYLVDGGAIAATTAYVSLYDYRQDTIASPIVTRSVGDFHRYGFVSFSRCALVNGASQTGCGLNVDSLPTSTNGLLLPGDQVQIGDELKIVTAPLNSNGSGQGYLQFSPAIRTAPADNTPVIIHRPMGKFLMSGGENGWVTIPGDYSNASLSLTEAID